MRLGTLISPGRTVSKDLMIFAREKRKNMKSLVILRIRFLPVYACRRNETGLRTITQGSLE